MRSEIMQNVIDPCYLDSAKRNAVEGVSPEDMVPLMKMLAGDAVEQAILSLLPIVAKLDTFEERAMFYVMGQQMCIQSARQAAGQ